MAMELGPVGYVPGELVGYTVVRNVMAQKASLHMATFAQIWLPLLHVTSMEQGDKSQMEQRKGCSERSVSTHKICLRWYDRTVTVPEVAGASRQTRSRTRT